MNIFFLILCCNLYIVQLLGSSTEQDDVSQNVLPTTNVTLNENADPIGNVAAPVSAVVNTASTTRAGASAGNTASTSTTTAAGGGASAGHTDTQVPTCCMPIYGNQKGVELFDQLRPSVVKDAQKMIEEGQSLSDILRVLADKRQKMAKLTKTPKFQNFGSVRAAPLCSLAVFFETIRRNIAQELTRLFPTHLETISTLRPEAFDIETSSVRCRAIPVSHILIDPDNDSFYERIYEVFFTKSFGEQASFWPQCEDFKNPPLIMTGKMAVPGTFQSNICESLRRLDQSIDPVSLRQTLHQRHPGFFLDLQHIIPTRLGSITAQQFIVFLYPGAESFEDCPFVFYHTPCEEAPKCRRLSEEAFDELKRVRTDEEKERKILECIYYFHVETPYRRGSAAIGSMLENALRLAFGLNIPKRPFSFADQQAQTLLSFDDFYEVMTRQDFTQNLNTTV